MLAHSNINIYLTYSKVIKIYKDLIDIFFYL